MIRLAIGMPLPDCGMIRRSGGVTSVVGTMICLDAMEILPRDGVSHHNMGMIDITTHVKSWFTT